ncbi:MAG: SPFH domain-containing protein [Proteobacteria bacterium]|nr:SPFH domain-containing protein [Pseudomonadota bacterium]
MQVLPLVLGVSIGVAALLVIVLVFGVVVIGELESGLVVRRYGPPLPPGRIIATRGEAGYQARMLPPGYHFGIWSWKFKVTKVPLIEVSPGQIALVVAKDGAPIPSERVLAHEILCDNYQDATQFLDHGGEKGRQIGILTAGKYRVNPALFDIVTAARATYFGLSPEQLQIFRVPAERVGIVTVLDGRPIASGDLAGPTVLGHDSFQRGQAFVDAGGCRGLQEDVLLSGAWNLNPWFASIELISLTEIPIGYVGVVVSYVGKEHLDVSGDGFAHGDLVDKGRKGVWVEPLLPGKHPVNTRAMKIELVPTTNIVLNWASRRESHEYDAGLSSITVRSRDGFSFNLDVASIIHIGMKNAPRVISRVGSMQNLVDHVLQPTVGNYFRNSAQEVTVLEFLSARSARQREAFLHIRAAVAAYDVDCIDALIGDITPPGELMKTQTDRKIADEMQRTYDAQREAQIRRQALERETAAANMQAEVVRSEQQVLIFGKNAEARVAGARGEAESITIRAEADAQCARLAAAAEADAARLRGDSLADAERARGLAMAASHEAGIAALGEASYTAIQLAQIIASAGLKLVPDVVMGDGRSNLSDVLLARMAIAPRAAQDVAIEVRAIDASAPSNGATNGANGVSHG